MNVLYADDICLLAPTASAMQTLLDVCYEYGIDNDIVFNPIKSVCTVFKPKAYKLYLPTVFIGSDALKFIKESKYLGFTFSDSKSDDCDMLRQMRLLYAKSNKLLRTFSHCSTDVKITLFQSYCTALYCPYLWNDYKKSTFSKVRVALIMLTEKYLVYLSGVVPVRCMQTTISVTVHFGTLKQL